MTQNVCDKPSTLPKMKNCGEYKMICIARIWGIVLEKATKWQKNPTQRNSEQKPTTMSKKLGFDNRQQYSNKQKTARKKKQIKFVDESIATLKLST